MDALVSKYPEVKGCILTIAGVGFTYDAHDNTTIMCPTATGSINGTKMRFIAFPGRISRTGTIQNVSISGLDFYNKKVAADIYNNSGPFSGPITWVLDEGLSHDEILRLAGYIKPTIAPTSTTVIASVPKQSSSYFEITDDEIIKKLHLEFLKQSDTTNEYIGVLQIKIGKYLGKLHKLNNKIQQANNDMARQHEKLNGYSTELNKKVQEIRNKPKIDNMQPASQETQEKPAIVNEHGIDPHLIKYLSFNKDNANELYWPNRYDLARSLLKDSHKYNFCISHGVNPSIRNNYSVTIANVGSDFKPEITIKFIDPEDSQMSEISRCCMGTTTIKMKYFNLPKQELSHTEFLNELVKIIEQKYKQCGKTLQPGSITVDILYSNVDFHQSYY